MIKQKFTLKNTFENFLLGSASEGWSSTQENVGNDSYAPNVHLMIIGLLLNDFRGHVEWATEYIVDGLFRLEEASESEISYLHIEVVVVAVLQKDILWLNIAKQRLVKHAVIKNL
jgi:hypothetical protein